MKKILLGTTGLVGAALLATAASAETPKVTLGGFSDFQAGWTNDDKDTGVRSTGFRNENTVTIKVDGKTGAGLGYGAEIDLQADITPDASNQGTNANRTFTYLEGNFGRIELGGNKSVAATQRVDASSLAVATGGINGAWTYFVNGQGTGANQLNNAAGTGFITNSRLTSEHGSYKLLGDEGTYNATKVSYYTPKYVGFQAGVSYTPQLADRGQTINRSDVSGLADVIDAGLTYDNTFGAYKVALAATYEHADGKGAIDTTSFGTDDVNEWNLGGLVGFKGFSLAASYGDYIDSGIAGTDGYYWTAGLGYTTGPIGLSATFLESQLTNSNVTTGGQDKDFNNVVLGADYKLAPGLTPYAEVSFYDFNGAGNATAPANYTNNGTVVILGTQVAF